MTEIRRINAHCHLGLLWLDEFAGENPCSGRRELEKKGTLYLLEQLFPGKFPELCYQSNGRPYVKNTRGSISISHSHNLLALFVDEINPDTGVDAERIREKVLKIRCKFLSEKEQAFIPEKNVAMHIMAWCAKETLYKIHAEGKVDFIQHLALEPFDESATLVKAFCKAGGKSFGKDLRIERHDEYILSYPLH